MTATKKSAFESEIRQTLDVIEKKVDRMIRKHGQKLDQIFQMVAHNHRMEHVEMAKLDDLLAKLNDQTTVVAGMKTTMETLATLVEQGRTDPAKLDEALAILTTNSDAIVAATVKGTSAATEDPND